MGLEVRILEDFYTRDLVLQCLDWQRHEAYYVDGPDMRVKKATWPEGGTIPHTRISQEWMGGKYWDGEKVVKLIMTAFKYGSADQFIMELQDGTDERSERS